MTRTYDPLPELIRALQAKSTESRLEAIHAIGRLGALARDAVPALADMLDDATPSIRGAAAQALGQMGAAALSALSAALTHPDKHVRRQAVWGVAKLGPAARSAIPDLCEALADSDTRTCTGAVQALGSFGAAAEIAVPALIECMVGQNRVLCRLAAKALSQIGPPALPTLIVALSDDDPFVRGEAAVALGWMGSAAAEAVPDLIGVLTAPSPAVETDPSHRVQAIQALGRIGSPLALPALREAILSPNATLREAASLAIRAIHKGSSA